MITIINNNDNSNNDNNNNNNHNHHHHLTSPCLQDGCAPVKRPSIHCEWECFSLGSGWFLMNWTSLNHTCISYRLVSHWYSSRSQRGRFSQSQWTDQCRHGRMTWRCHRYSRSFADVSQTCSGTEKVRVSEISWNFCHGHIHGLNTGGGRRCVGKQQFTV